jgi:hypothetical protein
MKLADSMDLLLQNRKKKTADLFWIQQDQLLLTDPRPGRGWLHWLVVKWGAGVGEKSIRAILRDLGSTKESSTQGQLDGMQ